MGTDLHGFFSHKDKEKHMANTTRKKCNSCCEMIDSSAKVCYHCGRHQKFLARHFGDTAIIVSIVMVAISVAQVFLAFKQTADASNAKETAVKAAIDANKALTKVLSDANEIERLKQQLLEQGEIHNLWLSFQAEENEESARIILNKLESKDPNNWAVYDYRAESYRLEAEREENLEKKKELFLKAKSEYEKSYERHKGKSIIYLADICAELDDEEGCRNWLERGMTDNSLLSLKDAASSIRNINSKYSNRDWFKKINWKENK
jgi:hypothetical protein